MPTDIINEYSDAQIHHNEESAPQRKRQRTGSYQGGQLTYDAPTVAVTQAVHNDPLNVASWSPRAKYLISKMRLMRFIDEATPAYLILWLAKTADKLFIYAGYGKTGDAAALLKRIHVGHTLIDQVLNADYADLSNNCSESNERENKDIYWTFASAFLICFYEVKAKKRFSIQYYHPGPLVAQFVKLYPDFMPHDGLLMNRLLTYHLCMQVAVSAFGRGVAVTESSCLVQLVTRMTEGREVALAIDRPYTENKFPNYLGAAPAETINSCRKTIFEKVFEIKSDPGKHREQITNNKTGKGGEKPQRRVHFSERLEQSQEVPRAMLDTIMEEEEEFDKKENKEGGEEASVGMLKLCDSIKTTVGEESFAMESSDTGVVV